MKRKQTRSEANQQCRDMRLTIIYNTDSLPLDVARTSRHKKGRPQANQHHCDVRSTIIQNTDSLPLEVCCRRRHRRSNEKSSVLEFESL
jgi:hypothetical protein